MLKTVSTLMWWTSFVTKPSIFLKEKFSTSSRSTVLCGSAVSLLLLAQMARIFIWGSSSICDNVRQSIDRSVGVSVRLQPVYNHPYTVFLLLKGIMYMK